MVGLATIGSWRSLQCAARKQFAVVKQGRLCRRKLFPGREGICGYERLAHRGRRCLSLAKSSLHVVVKQEMVVIWCSALNRSIADAAWS